MHVGIVSFTDVDSGIDLANALDEIGAKVTYYMSRSHAERTAGDSKNPVERLYNLGILSSNVNTRLFQLKRMRDLGSYHVMQNIAKAIREDEVDVAHILVGSGEIWAAVLACLIKDVPVASTMIIPKPNIGEKPPAPVVLFVNKILASGSDILIVNGKDHISFINKIYRFPKERIRYIPLGPRNVFLRWSQHITSENSGTVLFQGRVNKHKGLEFLVRAQPMINNRCPSANFIIAGQGNDLDRCRGLMHNPERFTIYDGFISGEQVADLFQRSSVVVVPYLTAATSGVVMTALVFSKPVVATRVGSLPEYVLDGFTGLLVPPRDERKLADAIIQLLSDKDLRERLGNNAGNFANGELSWNKLASDTMCAYHSAIECFKDRFVT